MRLKNIDDSYIDSSVTLHGWIKKIRKLGELIFIDIREQTEIFQLRIEQTNSSLFELVSILKNQFLIEVEGVVKKRKEINSEINNGHLELFVSKIKIISSSNSLPFIIEDKTDALEQKRMQYRYLDLRRPTNFKMLKFRSDVYRFFRNYLDSQSFIEVETPAINVPTIGGSKELLVNSTNFEDSNYTLSQSPQVYKQLLMISGVDKYFQIAKCFRDEKARSDRQMEFTQLDIEMSFTTEGEVKSLVEGMLQKLFTELLSFELPTVFPKIEYKDAILKYGSDKPDTRFDYLIEEIKKEKLLEQSSNPFLKKFANQFLFSLKLPIVLSTSKLKKYVEKAKSENELLFWVKKEKGTISSSLKPLEETFVNSLEINDNEIIFFNFKPTKEPMFLGRLRVELAKEFDLISSKERFNFLWVEHFPMFTIEDNVIGASHHPFTAPLDENFFNEKNIEEIKKYDSKSYDLVLNGNEIGGGSIRINNPKNQRFIFEKLGFSDKEINYYIGWFLEALSYGTPPHGGIAIGIDRLLAIMLNKETIREVIAFPKTSKATDELTKGPYKKNDKI